MSNGYQFIDGFDNYTTLSTMYETIQGSPTIGTAFRRFPPPSPLTGQGANLPQNAFIRKNLQSNQATVVVCFAASFTLLPFAGTDWFVQLLDNGTCQDSLAVSNTGTVQFYRGNQSVAIYNPTSPGLIAPNTYHGFVLQITISGSVGQVALWMDGTQLLSSSANLNTQVTANSYVNQVQFGRGNVSGGLVIDDVVVMDAVGNWFNGVVGNDGRLFTKMPSGVGDLTAWTAVGSANNFSCCNEIPPDEDTTYVTSPGSGQQDSYVMQGFGLTVAPYGFVARSRVRKDDASAHTFKNGSRCVANNGLSSAFTISSTYQWYDSPLQNDPHTGSPWTGPNADGNAQVLKEATS